jgi:hypothetical protein
MSQDFILAGVCVEGVIYSCMTQLWIWRTFCYLYSSGIFTSSVVLSFVRDNVKPHKFLSFFSRPPHVDEMGHG